MRRSVLYRCGGMTLVEIMVAVAITVGMMLLIGTVFKSATDASGSALALNEVNGQARVVTEQLQSDFSGFQKDLPFAIIFQAHRDDTRTTGIDPYPELGDPDEPGKLVRYDRICFFAGGNFEPTLAAYPLPLSGNLSRVFYGQILDSPVLKLDNDVSAPRQILTRRQKIMTVDGNEPGVGLGNPAPYVYDAYPFEFTWYADPLAPGTYRPSSPTTFWKHVDPTMFATMFFVDDPGVPLSIVRRSLYEELRTAPEALQKMQLMSDVTDFKIQLYLFDNNPTQQRWRWFPNDQDFSLMAGLVGAGNPLLPFAFYWNVADLDNTASPTPLPFVLPDWTMAIRVNQNIPWYSPTDAEQTLFLGGWPKAIRFTFTLYDKNRQRFGEGQTYSYIVKIPPRY